MIPRGTSSDVRAPVVRPYLGRMWHRWRDRRRLAFAVDLVPAILARVRLTTGGIASSDWVPKWSQWSQTGAAVIGLGPPLSTPVVVLKVAGSAAGIAGLQAEVAALAKLSAMVGLGAWRQHLPRVVAEGELSGWFYTLQQSMTGDEGMPPAAARESREGFLKMAAAAIRPLHERTGADELAGEWLLARDVERHLERIVRAAPSDLPVQREVVTRRVAAEMQEMLTGRKIRTSWIHGDYWPGNLLVAPEGGRLAAIVDWSMAEPRQLALHDLLHLVLYTRQVVQGRELGDVVAEMLEGGEWDSGEAAVLDEGGLSLPAGRDGQRAMLILYWLRRLGSVFDQERGHSRNGVWVAWNVDRVLRCL